MFIETERFGNFDLKDGRIIHFPLGIPGFEELHLFIILEISESRPLYWLQSVENKYIALPVIIPFDFVDDYYIDVRENELMELKIEDKNDLLVMNVVVIPEKIQNMTVNLASPIIINAREGLGKQIIVDAKELPVRYPIYTAIMERMKGGASNAGSIEKNG
ncbi:MAG: flagellar assembly protein FliW [Bacillota bacterium]